MRIKRTVKRGAIIPTASTADIAFLLFIFFIVSTDFRKETGLPDIQLPIASSETLKKVPKRGTARIWISKDNQISIDDHLYDVNSVKMVAMSKLADDPALLVVIKGDRNCDYSQIDAITEQLRKANALRVSLVADYKD